MLPVSSPHASLPFIEWSALNLQDAPLIFHRFSTFAIGGNYIDHSMRSPTKWRICAWDTKQTPDARASMHCYRAALMHAYAHTCIVMHTLWSADPKHRLYMPELVHRACSGLSQLPCRSAAGNTCSRQAR